MPDLLVPASLEAGHRGDPLRVAVIGTGWASRVHVPAFRGVEGFEVTALGGRDPLKLERRATALDIPSWTTDCEELATSEEIDVVSVGTPSVAHAPIVNAALAAGKHVLCEKPLAPTFAEAYAMHVAAKVSTAQAAVCFEYRWSDEHVAVRDLVASGALGTISFVSIHRIGGYARLDRPTQSAWMYRLVQGGGFLANALSHDIDFILDVFGPPAEVSADVRVVVSERDAADGSVIDIDADDTSALLLRLDRGTLAVVTNSFVASSESYSLDIVGSLGSISVRVDDSERRASVHLGGASSVLAEAPRVLRSGVVPSGTLADATRWTALLLEDWLPALHGGVGAAPTMEDGMMVHAVIEGARCSSLGQGWVPIGHHDVEKGFAT